MVWVGGRCSDGCLSGAARAGRWIPQETSRAASRSDAPHRQENAKHGPTVRAVRMPTSDTHYL